MIGVRYKCKCMQDERELQVAERAEGDDVIVWMEGVVALAVSNDHRQLSPNCRETTMEYLKIPLPEGSPQIGTKPKLN